MKLYKVVFSSDSPIGEIPDSKRIFGALCHVIKYTLGEEELKKYFESFKSDPWFIHSSMFIDGYFPMVKKNIFDLQSVSEKISNYPSKEKIRELSQFKKYKKVKFISEEVFKDYILNNNISNMSNGILSNDLKIVNGILYNKNENVVDGFRREDFSTFRVRLYSTSLNEDGRLFNDNYSFYNKDTRFVIFVKSNQFSQEKLINIFKYFNYFPLGNKGSIGRNLFKLEEIVECSYCSNNGDERYLLSKLIPNKDEIELNNSYYNIVSMNSIGSRDYLNNSLIGNLNFISEGSLVKAKKDKEYYGQLLKVKIMGKEIYQYGIGFVV